MNTLKVVLLSSVLSGMLIVILCRKPLLFSAPVVLT